jgi:ubiquinone/menaquinone biosynthesis C-methylase UbiE
MNMNGDIYDQIAQYYDLIVKEHSNIEPEINFLKGIFEKYKISSVLDIACGSGRHSIQLAQEGFSVTGVDRSSLLIEQAKIKADNLDITFDVQDVANFQFQKKFDAAICMWSTFGELPYIEMLLQLQKIIKDNGILIIDSKYWETIPKSGNKSKEKSIQQGDLQISWKIDDSFNDNQRIRQINYIIGDKRISGEIKMDILTVEGLTKICNKYNFYVNEIYYDYKPQRDQNVSSFQIVCKKK